MRAKGIVCPGCGRHELHKMCPAWGTPFYMSGELFTPELEEEWRERREQARKDYKPTCDCIS
jgi:hypothetical protein